MRNELIAGLVGALIVLSALNVFMFFRSLELQNTVRENRQAVVGITNFINQSIQNTPNENIQN